MKDIINKYVKHREEFRPFAPAVLEEEFENYFDIKQKSPFMTIVCNVQKGVEEKLPATTHFDGTSRVQTVSREKNQKYWELIRRFGDLSGTPVLLNTSYNVRGEPIVCTPYEAIRCFYGSGMDHLAIGNYILSKENIPDN